MHGARKGREVEGRRVVLSASDIMERIPSDELVVDTGCQWMGKFHVRIILEYSCRISAVKAESILQNIAGCF